MSEIIEKIKASQAKMKPKWFFILRGALIFLVFVFLFFMIAFLFSLALFIFKRGFVLFPTILVIISVMGIFALEAFASTYAVTYRRPLLYSLIAILLFIVLLQFAILRLHLHESLMERAERDDLPAAGRLYRHYRGLRPPPPEMREILFKN